MSYVEHIKNESTHEFHKLSLDLGIKSNKTECPMKNNREKRNVNFFDQI